VITTNFPSAIQDLQNGIASAKNSQQNQGVNQLQVQFLNRLQSIQKSVKSILAMVQAVETTLTPPTNWRSKLNFSSLINVVNDFSTRVTTGNFDIVGQYDNINLQLDPVVQNIKNECNKVWLKSRDSILSAINLDFEAPNARILRAIDPAVKLPVTFNTLQRRLQLQKNDEFARIWADCGDDPSKFSDYVNDLQDSVQQFKDAVDPVVTALSNTDPKVAEFLNDATKGQATMRQVESKEVKEWLTKDQELLDSFLVRFKDEN